MKYFVEETLLDEQDKKNAGGKARQDVTDILESIGYQKLIAESEMNERQELNAVQRLVHHYKVKKMWKKTLSVVGKGDEIIIQFPLLNHSLFFNQVIKQLSKNGVKVYFLIHDLESLRWSQSKSTSLKSRIRLNIEERSVLRLSEGIIAHNKKMKSYIKTYSVESSKIIPLEIFDYIIPSYHERKNLDNFQLNAPIVIAGNLKQHKAGYVYHLPSNVEFNLYGIGYEQTDDKSVHYCGSFMPEELPFVLKGSFGLVWDGPSSESCIETYGEYLRVNNPHKTSLYLASGIPVVVWSEAAIASFIKENNCGILVSNLSELPELLSMITVDEYELMKKNTEIIGERLRQGFYTKQAVKGF